MSVVQALSRSSGRRALLLLGVAVSLLPRARARSAETAAAQTGTGGAGQVTIDNFAFAPALLAVAAGSTVTWTNRDDIPHSIVCPALKLHSHALDTDQSFSAVFPTAGLFDYNCGLHPHMHGQIAVT